MPLNLAAQGYHTARAQAQASMPERGHLMRHPALPATALGVERLRGDRVSMRRALDDAIPINERSGRSLGQSPLATEISLCHWGWALGETQSAREVLTNYVMYHRREARPYPTALHSEARTIGISGVLDQ